MPTKYYLDIQNKAMEINYRERVKKFRLSHSLKEKFSPKVYLNPPVQKFKGIQFNP